MGVHRHERLLRIFGVAIFTTMVCQGQPAIISDFSGFRSHQESYNGCTATTPVNWVVLSNGLQLDTTLDCGKGLTANAEIRIKISPNPINSYPGAGGVFLGSVLTTEVSASFTFSGGSVTASQLSINVSRVTNNLSEKCQGFSSAVTSADYSCI